MKREDKLELARAYVQGLLEEDEQAEFERLAGADTELSAMMRTLTGQESGFGPRPASRSVINNHNNSLPLYLFNILGRYTPPRRVRYRHPGQTAVLVIGAMLFLALGLGLGILLRPGTEPLARVVLQSEADARAVAILHVFGDDSLRLLPLDTFIAPPGQVLQVWTRPPDTIHPTPLGTLTQTVATRFTGPVLPSPIPGQLYHITLEPAPGSPTGRPDGPVIAQGVAYLDP